MELITLEVLFLIFFCAIVIDFGTGVLSAAKQGKLKSRTCSDGMFRSIGECIVLSMFLIVNKLIPSFGAMMFTLICGFIFKETLSICENLNELGVWIPNFIKKSLEENANKADKGEL